MHGEGPVVPTVIADVEGKTLRTITPGFNRATIAAEGNILYVTRLFLLYILL